MELDIKVSERYLLLAKKEGEKQYRLVSNQGEALPLTDIYGFAFGEKEINDTEALFKKGKYETIRIPFPEGSERVISFPELIMTEGYLEKCLKERENLIRKSIETVAPLFKASEDVLKYS